MITHTKKLVVFLLCFVSFWACKPDDEPQPGPTPGGDTPETEKPAEYFTEKGQLEGTAVTAAIGPEGVLLFLPMEE